MTQRIKTLIFVVEQLGGGAHNYYQDQAVVGGDYTYYDNSDDNYAALFTISSKHGSVNENYYSLGYTGARLCYKPSVDEK